MHEDVFCAGKEAVFAFLEGVLAEVIAIFPSTYLHIGGDEVCLMLRYSMLPFPWLNTCQASSSHEGILVEHPELSSAFCLLFHS